MKKKLMVVVCFCISVYSGALFADSNASDFVPSQLESVLTAHVVASTKESESISDLMKTMHSGSPISMHLKTQMEQVFPVFDLNVSLVEFNFVGVNGDYAIARAKQKLEKISGPASL